MDFFGGNQTAADPQWVRSKSGSFLRLADLDPEESGLTGISGVYVIWNGGVSPAWVYVGMADDLAAAMHAAGGDEDIMQYEVHGRLYVTWASVRKNYQPGVVRFLTEALQPRASNPEAAVITAKPVPVLPPAYDAL